MEIGSPDEPLDQKPVPPDVAAARNIALYHPQASFISPCSSWREPSSPASLPSVLMPSDTGNNVSAAKCPGW